MNLLNAHLIKKKISLNSEDKILIIKKKIDLLLDYFSIIFNSFNNIVFTQV